MVQNPNIHTVLYTNNYRVKFATIENVQNKSKRKK